MNRYKTAAIVFIIIGFMLSHAMCAQVAFEYCNMLWGIAYRGYSAPASVAFLLAIPYLLGIMIAFTIAFFLWRKAKHK